MRSTQWNIRIMRMALVLVRNWNNGKYAYLRSRKHWGTLLETSRRSKKTLLVELKKDLISELSHNHVHLLLSLTLQLQPRNSNLKGRRKEQKERGLTHIQRWGTIWMNQWLKFLIWHPDIILNRTCHHLKSLYRIANQFYVNFKHS